MDPKVAISLMSLQSQVQGLQGGLHKNFANDIQYPNYANYNSSPSNSSSSSTGGVSALSSNHGRRTSMSDITRGIYNLNNNINANRMNNPVVKEKLSINNNTADSRSTSSSVPDINSLENFQLGGSRRPGVESDAEDGSSSVASFKGISGIREESGILHAENYSLRKIKRALEEELEKTRRELAEAQAKLNSASPDSIKPKPKVINGNYLDSDVQKLCDLSKFLSDENASLQSKIKEMETELKTLRDDKENQESDFRKLSEAISKAMEEATAAQKTIKSMQEEDVRLKQEKSRLESVIKTGALALEKAENENHNLRATAERLELAVRELQRELSETRREPLNGTAVLASDHRDPQYIGQRDQRITTEEELRRRITSADCTGSSGLAKPEDESSNNNADQGASSALTFLSVLRNQQPASSAEGQRFNPEEDAALIMEIQRMTSGLSTSMLQMEEELLRWKDRVGDLENALSIAKEAADSSDKKATRLISEFRWMQSVLGFSDPNPTAPPSASGSCSTSTITAASPLMTDPCPSPSPSLDGKTIMAASRYKLPATIASSAFAGASMLAAMKFTKYCAQSTAK